MASIIEATVIAKQKSATLEPVVTDDYLRLVKRFPLRPIRTEAENDQALEILEELIRRADHPGLTPGEKDYADAIGRSIGDYEDQHYPIQDVMKTPIERLKYLMEPLPRHLAMIVT